MLTGDRSSELLTDVAHKVAEMARATPPGVAPDDFGRRVAAMLADDWGGLSVYIPKDKVRYVLQRNAEILARFTGDNIPDLARQYGISEQRVYVILKSERERRKARRGSLLEL